MNANYQVQESRLGAGRYTMTVVNIHECVKSFPGRNGRTYRHDISFQDDDGIQYKQEYLTTTAYQREFMVGEICCFEVVNPNMNEIIKCKDVPPLIAKPTEPADELFGVKVAGSSHALALSFAKDLAVARIRMGHIMGDEQKFMDDILDNAWKMNQWLLNPKEPDPF